MSSWCKLAEPFFDGELPPDRADAFRAHAATCEACQRELAALAQLHALEVHHRPEFEARIRSSATAPRAMSPPPSWRLVWAGGGALAMFATMLVAWLAWSRFAEQVPESTFHPGGAERLIEGRDAYWRAREYRPLKQGVLGPVKPEPRSRAAVSRLQESHDVLGAASAELAGRPRDVEGVLDDLQKGLSVDKRDPDILSQLALAHLIRGDVAQGDLEQALRLSDEALEAAPGHGPASWNRALALQGLGLEALAARAFMEIAAQRESGWSEEARRRAEGLKQASERQRKAWSAAKEAGKNLIKTGTQPSPDLLGVPLFRHYFYDAIRSRTSADEVQRLRSLAQQMDSRAGDRSLQEYVDWVAGRDFTTRATLAGEYQHLAVEDQTEVPAAFLQSLRRANEPDLLLGALWKANLKPDELNVDELGTIARKLDKDDWLHTAALFLQATALAADTKRLPQAQAALEQEIQACQRARRDYRCAEAELKLAYTYDADPSQLDQVSTHAHRGWDAARRAEAWDLQIKGILELAQLARHRQDFSIAHVLYEESLERAGDDPGIVRYANEGLASLDVQGPHPENARQHIDLAIDTGIRLGLPGALALSDIARLGPPKPHDEQAMKSFQARLSNFHGGERALAEHALGRWSLEFDHTKGMELLRASIQHATADGLSNTDPTAQRAVTYSYTSLLFDAGKRRDAEGALRLFEEEWHGGLPSRCLLAVTYDAPERVMAVIRGPEGGSPSLYYDTNRRPPLPRSLKDFLPPTEIGKLQGCSRVDVLARPPLYGRPGLLPSSFAWSYRGPVAPGVFPEPPPRRHLVVQEVLLSADRRLPTPARWDVKPVAGELVDELSHLSATPHAVLQRMKDATDITLIVHSRVRPETEEAYLVLAPEGSQPDGTRGDELRVSDILNGQLQEHPLVVLAACQSAQPAPVLHEARNLPAAFLRIGARAVLAASDPVPERDGPEFFGGVRARMRAGIAPAEALRAERAHWVATDRQASWLDGVLLFE